MPTSRRSARACLSRRLRETDTSIDNLLNAIQQGILTKSTKARLETLESTKEELEIRIHDIEEEMCQEDVLSDYLRLDALGEELAQTKDKLEDCYGRWMQEDE